MTPITRGQRIFFGVIFAAALLVAVLGYFVPTALAATFNWLELPPLHARFVGAIYGFGAVFMLGCMLARYWAEVRLALPMTAIWTAMLFIISITHLSAFDFSGPAPWIWFASYSIYPLVAMWLYWQQRRKTASHSNLGGPMLPNWARGFLVAQGAVVTLLALALFVAPNMMATVWPWKVTPLLAQTYAGPLFAYGVGSLAFGRKKSWVGVRALAPAMLTFTTGALIASFIHWNLFSVTEGADMLWFSTLIVSTVMLALLTMRAFQIKVGEETAVSF